MDDPQLESATAESANAAAVSKEADTKAIAAHVASALDAYFNRGVQEKRFVDVGRIPFICDDIRGIHQLLEVQKTTLENQGKIVNKTLSDLGWMKWIGSGFVGAAGLLALKALGV